MTAEPNNNLLRLVAKLADIAVRDPAMYRELVALQATHPDTQEVLIVRRLMRQIQESAK